MVHAGRRKGKGESVPRMPRFGVHNLAVTRPRPQPTGTPYLVFERGVAWNLAGSVLPLIAAMCGIPKLAGELGSDRFGLLALAWSLLGYFSVFDLGISRALTNWLATSLHSGGPVERRDGLCSATLILLACGSAGGVLLASVAKILAHRLSRDTAVAEPEVLAAIYFVCLGVPMVTVGAGFRSVLEARLLFAQINAVRAIASMFVYLGPLPFLRFSRSLALPVAMLVLARLITCLAYWVLGRHSSFRLGQRPAINWALVRHLFKLGGWMTISNVISPLMASLDRLLVAVVLSPAAVAWYAAPQEIVSRLLVIPSAVVGVLFPAASGAPLPTRRFLYRRALCAVLCMGGPLVFICVAFAGRLLMLWLGGDFAERGRPVAQILLVGIFVNSLAHVPFTLLQAAGRPDITGKLHICEFPVFLGMMFWLTRQYGIVGAAAGWTLRVAIDAAALFAFAQTYAGLRSRQPACN